MSRILVVFLVLGVACSLADPINRNDEVTLPQLDGRIVGGLDTNITFYPHQISMRYNGNHRCGGSIYRNNQIISAAHCVNTLSGPENLTIVAGSSNIWYPTGPQQQLAVRKFIIHPNYRKLNNDYDAAILILDGEFEFNEAVQPIELAKERPEHDTPVTVTGWGTTTEDGYLSDVLQEVSVNMVENTQCKSAYSIMLTSRMLCAGVTGGGKDACQGDSGGPLVYNNTLLGIVSWGTGCAREKYPGVYASVPDVRDWIIKTVEENEFVGKIDFL
ncbi:trypsin delta [Drosophila eugracilis]|uniref:trypsin delta n=1 Tax=Drosophila eugracilis TaxID=29029 RepID=UPI0007E638C0|nr:trypsin delta [Drosophila eugracilis]